MFAIKVIDWSNKEKSQQLLESYFHIRHKIYVETRNWADIARPIPMEIDAFDNRHAIYLIGVNNNNHIQGGTRLVPTTRPHLLSAVFPELACYNPPRAADIVEWTRFFVAPELRQPNTPSMAAGIVLCGMLEYALKHAITAITVVCETFWLDRLKGLGWKVDQLGPTLAHRDGGILALLITVDAGTLELTKQAYRLPLSKTYLVEDTMGQQAITSSNSMTNQQMITRHGA